MIQDESGSNALSAPSLKLVALATSVCMDAEVLSSIIFKIGRHWPKIVIYLK